MCLSRQQSTFWQWSLIFGYDSPPLRKVHDRSHVAQKKLVAWYSSMCSYLKCYYLLIWQHILSSDNQSLMVPSLVEFGRKFWINTDLSIYKILFSECLSKTVKRVGRQKPSKRASGLSPMNSMWTILLFQQPPYQQSVWKTRNACLLSHTIWHPTMIYMYIGQNCFLQYDSIIEIKE